MSSTQATVKSPNRRLIYGSVLVLIIALSAATAFLSMSNLSLQKELTYNQLLNLSENAGDIDRRIELFVATYYHKLTGDLDFVLDSAADNETQTQAIRDFLSTLRTCAEEAYYDFRSDIRQIEYLSNNVNRTAYENISEIVRLALGQVGEIGVGKVDFVMQVDGLLLINQLSNVIGIDKATQYPTSGLRGIAWSFGRMSNYWYEQATNQLMDWLPTPQVSLNLALANATELYASLTAWDNFTSHPALA